MNTVAEPAKAQASASRTRPPSTIYTVQALRGVAALLVVFQHLSSMWHFDIMHSAERIPFRGTTGVDIFFVISGFIMPLSIRRIGSNTSSASTFLIRRLERIVPIYWICTLLKYVLLRASPDLSEHGNGSTWHVVSSFLFLPSFNAQHAVGPLLQPAWTLIWEMLFYVLIALSLALGAPLRYFLPPVLIGLGSLYFLHVPANIPLDSRTIPLMVEFLFGLALSVRYRSRLQTGAAAAPAALATFAGIAAFVVLVFYPPSTYYPLFFGGFLATAIVGSALELEDRIGHRIPRLLLLLGDASYSLYLTHWFLVSIFRRYLGHSPLARMTNATIPMLLMAAICCIVGILAYHFVESPINTYFRVRRRTATRA